ncbi:MAG: hypothetical protein MJ252_06730 [archaeon]|nr:hypothetical protein [archaeon]
MPNEKDKILYMANGALDRCKYDSSQTDYINFYKRQMSDILGFEDLYEELYRYNEANKK